MNASAVVGIITSRVLLNGVSADISSQSQIETKEEIETKECPVCYDEIATTNNCITSCGHTFCLSCMLKCMRSNNCCPCCRTSLIDKIEDYSDSDSETNDSDSETNDSEIEYDTDDSDISIGYSEWLRERRTIQRIRREEREHILFNDEVIIIDIDGTISASDETNDDDVSIWSDIDEDEDEDYHNNHNNDNDNETTMAHLLQQLQQLQQQPELQPAALPVLLLEDEDNNDYHDDGYGYFGSDSESDFLSKQPQNQWECIRSCEQQVVDIDINWLMTMC
jgi:hypothetical protein